MTVALAIFAKTIGSSPVKTRLAATIGRSQAEEFYRYSVDAVEDVVSHALTLMDDTLRPFWAVAEKECVADDRWSKFPSLWTGDGGLGERLHHVYSTLLNDHDAVLLMGTDSPQLSPRILVKATEHLLKENAPYVIGPCTDGGFYLFGGSQIVDKSVWTTTPYSCSNTLSLLLRHFSNDPTITLPIHQDVDIEADIEPLIRTLQTQLLLPRQTHLLHWAMLALRS